MKPIRHYVYLNGKRYDWNEGYGDYIFAFTSKSGDPVVKRWRKEVAKLNRVGAARSIGDDVDRRKAEKRLPLELMRSEEYDSKSKTNGSSINYHEKLKEPDELNKEFDKRTRNRHNAKYVRAWTSWGAKRFLYKKFGIEAGEDYYKLPLGIANNFNCELVHFYNVFGTVGFIDSVIVDSGELPPSAEGGFDPNVNAILLRSNYCEPSSPVSRPRVTAEGFPIVYYYSTGSSKHLYRHEIAHALYHFVVEKVDPGAKARAKTLYRRLFIENNGEPLIGVYCLSRYAKTSEKEMFAEAVAMMMDSRTDSSFARKVVNYVLFGEAQ